MFSRTLVLVSLFALAQSTQAFAENWRADRFDEGILKRGWVTNSQVTFSGDAMSQETAGNIRLSDPLPEAAGRSYLVQFSGVKVSTPNAEGDNWIGLMDFSKGWSPERGVALRVLADSRVEVCVDLGGAGQLKELTQLKLDPDQAYDFAFQFAPGGEVQVYYRTGGDLWTVLAAGGIAPEVVPTPSIYSESSLFNLSGVTIDLASPKEIEDILGGLRKSPVAAAVRDASPVPLPASTIVLLDNLQKIKTKGFPIGFWNYVKLENDLDAMDEAAVDSWVEMGCNVVQAPFWNPDDPKQKDRIKQILDWSEKRGVKVILRDPRLASDKFDEATAEFGHHPAMFGYHIGDELGPKEMMGPISEMTRKLQERLPLLHTHYNQFAVWPEWELFPGYKSPLDFELAFVEHSKSVLLSYDNYTQLWPGVDGQHPKYGATGWDKFFLNLKIFREASAQSGVPFWSSLCSASHMLQKVASYDQLRWQFNAAVCAGANGIEYFMMYEWDPAYNYRDTPIDAFWEKTPTFFHLKKIHNSFHKRYGDLFTRIVPTRFTFVGKVYGDGTAFTPNGVISYVGADEVESHKGHPVLVGEFVDREGGRYVMIVNNSITESVKVKLRFPGKETKIFSWAWNGKRYEGLANAETKVNVPQATVVGNEIEIVGGWLAPGQEIVYQVESQSARATPSDLLAEK